MPIQYVDGHPTIAVDVANDRFKVNDATLEQKVNDLNTKIDALNTKIDTMQDGTSPVSTQLTGSNLTQDPETGNKTITATPAEVFAGWSPLQGRNKLLVYNASQEVVKWGNGTVDTNTGFSLLPGDSIVFSFKPETYVPIFFVATTDSVVEVGELA